MNDSDLRDLLTQLHARLGNTPSLDADDKRLLVTVLADIENALARQPDARPPDACLRIGYQPGQVVLEITSNGSTAPADSARVVPGRGIAGMRERVALYGGDLDVGPRTEGGFVVRACFPLEAMQS